MKQSRIGGGLMARIGTNNTVFYDEDFGLEMVKKGFFVKPFRPQKRYRVGDVLTKALKPRLKLVDKRSISYLQGKWDWYDEPSSIYTPDALKTAILKYYDGVKEVRSQRSPRHTIEGRQALSDLISAFKPKKTVNPLDTSFTSLASGVKLETSSGYPNYEKKVHQLEYAYNRVSEVSNFIKRPSPCTSFDRTQRLEGESEKSKVRLIWAFPIEMTMLEGRFARPLIDYYTEFKVHPVALGWSKMQMGTRMIAVANSTWQYSLDYSQFDARVPSWFIDFAFKVISQWLNLVEELDLRQFKIVQEYFKNTPLLTPWGILYGKDSGIPSGSYFTQIVGSMYNYFLISYLFRINGLQPFKEKINVLGDDGSFGSPYKLRYFEDVRERFKCIINESKSHISDKGEVHFLGRNWKNGIPHVDPKKSRTKFVLPERNRNIDWDQVSLVAGSYLMEGVENAAWVNSILGILSPGRFVRFKDVRRERDRCDDEMVLGRYGAWGGHKVDFDKKVSLIALGVFA